MEPDLIRKRGIEQQTCLYKRLTVKRPSGHFTQLRHVHLVQAIGHEREPRQSHNFPTTYGAAHQ